MPAAPSNGAGLLGRLFQRKPVDEAPEERPGGFYLVGEVGRGKSMLMDLFFEAAEVPRKRRVHCHAFMQNVHARLHAARLHAPFGAPREQRADDPIPPLADAIARQSALLCFDEFQITDVADALLLGRLFEALFARGVVVVATSNTAPDDLFRGQPGRDAFLPFIDILKRNLDVLVIDGVHDYRRALRPGQPRWLVPADARTTAALDAAFAALTEGVVAGPVRLLVMGRVLFVPLAARNVARFDFATLCGQPLGPGDYVALATHFRVLVLDRVPRLGPDDRDAARRFIALIDTLYEHRVKLLASADAEPDALHTDTNTAGDGAKAFARTASRLIEMQAAAWLALPHLT
jgi:cell division protein ZapE